MVRKRIIAWMKRGACISLAAVILSAAAVPSAGMLVFAQEDTVGSVVSEEEAITEEGNEENREKDVAQQKEETESDAIAVKGKISQDPQEKAGDIYPEGFSLNKSQYTLTEGATFQLKADGFSANATNKELTWTTSDPDVATVDENGLVTAVGAGTAVITATSVGKNEGQAAPASDSCTFTVEGVEDVYEYKVNGNAVTITGYNGAGGEVVIPATIDGKPVTELGTYSFWLDDNITSVVIPEGVTTIGKQAFNGDDNLASVTLPSTLRTIGERAFYSTAIQDIVIPEGVTSIAKEAFKDCDQLADVTLPSTLKTVGANAFNGCTSLQEAQVLLPDNITSLGLSAFGDVGKRIPLLVVNGTTTLKTLEGMPGKFEYTVIDRYPESITLDNSQLKLVKGEEGTLAVKEFTGNPTNKDVTWESDNEEVATVDENGIVTAASEGTAVITATCVGANAGQEGPATAQCTVKVVNKEGAFLYTTNAEGITVEGYTGAVMMLTVPDEIAGKPVTAVADGAFSDCKYIADLTLPDTITSVGENAFEQVTNLVARKGTKTADALETEGLEYLAKVTVTLTTEYYNRDGSLSDAKSRTSTYTRREGNKIDMGTAITSRGWIQEKKTVTGMTDTDPALYGVEGIAGEEDIVIKFVWREDNLGPEGKGDKIPDQYQMEASFEVKNGTWDDGTSEVVEKLVTLRDESGDPAAEGTIEADAPAVGQAPAEGYEAGSWSPDIAEKMTIADEGTTFVYSYAEKEEVKPDPEEPEEDTPGEDNPGTDNPDKDTDKNKEDKDSADNQKSNGEVQTGDTSPVGAAAGLLLVSGGVIIGTEALRRRKND